MWHLHSNMRRERTKGNINKDIVFQMVISTLKKNKEEKGEEEMLLGKGL